MLYAFVSHSPYPNHYALIIMFTLWASKSILSTFTKYIQTFYQIVSQILILKNGKSMKSYVHLVKSYRTITEKLYSDS